MRIHQSVETVLIRSPDRVRRDPPPAQLDPVRSNAVFFTDGV